MSFERELAVATDVLRHASRLSLAVLASSNKGVHNKDDLSPVTVADFAIQALLSATFSFHFPGDALVGEEDAAALRADPALCARVAAELAAIHASLPADALARVPVVPDEICRVIDLCAGSSAADSSRRTWVFDPIDGTQAFIRNQLFAINVGLISGKVQVFGAVGCPNLCAAIDSPSTPIRDASVSVDEGCIFTAIAGEGAYVQPMRMSASLAEPLGPARRLLKPRTASVDVPVTLVGCASMPKSAYDEVHQAAAKRLGTDFPGSDLISWVVRYCALALGCGNAAVWVYRDVQRRSKIWDHAGAQLVYIEAGGRVTDTRGEPMDFAAGRLMANNFGILAADEDVYDRVKGSLHEAMREFERKEID
ncbi:PAP-specific phosphatase HAL2-like [Ceratocystis fimbriata CBS 114723]|uniref:3'(2') 5'-bisphosphate nucleotidase n=2 Tax=Ceratocystis TaxID=5157 RepID=A0A0F8B4K8_CERFI|nr:3'(2') 5'-bisphosphate nucleotidase [Ceratocystis platani]PHH50767.1 PAP-specific phosphatase HAL2-like [Ceratocystis fimbriata CBS 114723]